jgi:hypothetical protein
MENPDFFLKKMVYFWKAIQRFATTDFLVISPTLSLKIKIQHDGISEDQNLSA